MLLFLIFAGALLAAAIGLVVARNQLHAVLLLVLNLVLVALLFLLLGAEYLAMANIIVYVGAVAVLFLFVVMMLELKDAHVKMNHKFLGGALIIAFVMALNFYEFSDVFFENHSYSARKVFLAQSLAESKNALFSNENAINHDKYTENKALDEAKILGISSENKAITPKKDLATSNTAELARSLYTRYLLELEIAGLILLVAVVASVALALQKAGSIVRYGNIKSWDERDGKGVQKMLPERVQFTAAAAACVSGAGEGVILAQQNSQDRAEYWENLAFEIADQEEQSDNFEEIYDENNANKINSSPMRKRQSVMQQLMRKTEVKLLNPEFGQGVQDRDDP